MKSTKRKNTRFISDRTLLLAMSAILILTVLTIVALETLPYERIQVENGTLYGKLEPAGETLVILISGSGPTDMDGNSPILNGRNDSLFQLGRALNQEGYATFRYDKRSAGKSRHSFKGQSLTFEDFVDDLEAIVENMHQKDYAHIYLAGHSQGSLLAMLIANRIPVDGVISLAGPGETIDQTLLRQLGEAYGMDSEQVKTIQSLREGTVHALTDDYMLSETNLRFIAGWMKYDPTVEATNLAVPLLIIQGTADSQVLVEDAQALKQAQPGATLFLLEDMNHLLKQVVNPEENAASYTDPSFILHSELIASIANFIDTPSQ